MERGRSTRMQAGGGGQKQRAAYYEDYAKPVLVNWPFMLVAAATLFIVGHFANRRAGRRLGGDYKKNSTSSEDPSGRANSSNGRGEEGSSGRRGNQPMTLAELRAVRAEAAEARLKRGPGTSGSPGAAKPTPLGAILLLGRKVDKLQEEASLFLKAVAEDNTSDSSRAKEYSRLLELLTQVQLEIDGVQSDESVRPHRKVQTNRVQRLISALEGVEKEGS